MSDVVIVGCGYIGIELGTQLQATGYDVTGVRRSDEGLDAIAAAGLTPHRADATDPASLTSLPDAKWVIFAASAGGRGADTARRIYLDGLQYTIDEYATRSMTPDRIVYTSSTGVYGDHGGAFVDETTPIEPTTDKTEVLADAERRALAASESGIDATVTRFAGLYGPHRYRLSRYLEGPVTEGYLNMVHRADAAGSIAYLLSEDRARNETVLVCDDEPVDKWVFADWLATECGYPEPAKRTVEERLADSSLSETAKRRIKTSKRCSNQKLRTLGYRFSHPTYRSGYHAAIEAVQHGRDPDEV